MMLLIPHLPLIDQEEQPGVASKHCTEISIHMWVLTRTGALAQGCVLFSQQVNIHQE